MNDDKTYCIQRFCFDETNPDHRRIIRTGLTLDEAQEHCNDPDTRGTDANGNPWFDGYQDEANMDLSEYAEDPPEHLENPDNYRGPDGILGNDFPDRGW